MLNHKVKADITELERIRWHCRRGMLELDVILGDYFQQSYQGLSPKDQQAFVDLLVSNDDQLYSWLVKKQTPEPELQAIITRILSNH